MLLRSFFALSMSLFMLASLAQDKGYSYKFKVEGLKDTTVYLANYYGGKMYYNDTTQVNGKGEFEFTGDTPKPGGIYAIIFPDRQTYFELIVNEPSFTLETKQPDLVKNMKVKGSPENEAFYKFVRRMTETQREVQRINAKKEGKSGEELEKVEAELTQLAEENEAFRQGFVEEHKDLFAAKVLNATRDPEVPEPPMLEDGTEDSTFQFRYFKEHYFDYVDMSDERMIRTSVLHNKIDYYIDKLTPQVSDSICSAVDYLVSMSGDTGLIFKYIVQYITNKYERSKIMGMDAVFVCMADKYYSTEKVWWLDSAQLAEILDTYETRKNLIIGQKAENIVLLDPEENWKGLYDIEEPYTVLIFWDPNCGHCKKELPKLKTFYDEWKSKGVEVFAVSTEFENKDWSAFLEKNELKDWVNVSDNPEVNKNAIKYITAGNTTLNSLNFRDYWDIFSTPQIYLLDKEKVIVGKRLAAEQLPDIIQQHQKLHQ